MFCNFRNFATLALLLLATLCSSLVNSEDPLLHVVNNDDIELRKVFDPRDKNAGYQRRYTIDVAGKSEECFFLPDVEKNQVLNYHFMVKNIVEIFYATPCNTKIAL